LSQKLLCKEEGKSFTVPLTIMRNQTLPQRQGKKGSAFLPPEDTKGVNMGKGILTSKPNITGSARLNKVNVPDSKERKGMHKTSERKEKKPPKGARRVIRGQERLKVGPYNEVAFNQKTQPGPDGKTGKIKGRII